MSPAASVSVRFLVSDDNTAATWTATAALVAVVVPSPSVTEPPRTPHSHTPGKPVFPTVVARLRTSASFPDCGRDTKAPFAPTKPRLATGVSIPLVQLMYS